MKKPGKAVQDLIISDYISGEELITFRELRDYTYKFPLVEIPANGVKIIRFKLSEPFHKQFITVTNDANGRFLAGIIAAFLLLCIAVGVVSIYHQQSQLTVEQGGGRPSRRPDRSNQSMSITESEMSQRNSEMGD